jgi:hypothetical protein
MKTTDSWLEIPSLRFIHLITQEYMTTDTFGSNTTYRKGTWLQFLRSKSIKSLIHSRPLYVNYEVLCNVFATKIVDFSKAEIYQVKTSEIAKPELEKFL